MSSFHNNATDLARAIRVGDLAAADEALTMMARDGDRATPFAVAQGRAAADREMGRVRPLPAIAAA